MEFTSLENLFGFQQKYPVTTKKVILNLIQILEIRY